MWISGYRFRRRRRSRASFGVIALFLGLFVGWDYVQAELQRREEYGGTIVRVYSERSMAGRRSFNHYWDIRSTDGRIHSARIRPKSVWSAGHSGYSVIKRAGELNPAITG
jgi:hypothetical protein